MANTNVGGVSWIVDANTAPATTSVQALDRQVNTATTSLGRLDTQTTRTSRSVNRSLGGFSRQAGMAGVQVQQFVGQLQGGQNAMLALSQQGADFGIVMGAPLVGAIVGISATIAGVLLPTLFDSKNAVDSLYSSMDTLKEVVTQSKQGVNALSNEYAELAKANSAAAEAALAIASIQAFESLSAAKEVIRDNIGIMQTWTGSLDDADEALAKLESTGSGLSGQLEMLDKAANANFGTWNALYKAVSVVEEEFGATREDALRLVKALRAVDEVGSVENFNELDSVIASIAETAGKANKKFNEFATTMVKTTKEGRLSAHAIETLNKVINGTGVEAEGASSFINKMIESLREEVRQLHENNRQTAIRIALSKGANEEQIKAINNSYDAIDAEEKRVKSVKAADDALNEMFKNEAKRAAESKKAQQQSLKDDEAFYKKVVKLKEQAEREEAKEKESSRGFAKGVIDRGMTPMDQLKLEHEQLLALKAKYVEDSKLYDEALTANANEQADLRLQYQTSNADMILNSASGMFGGLASMLERSGEEQSSAYKAMFALSKGFAVAQAGLNLALAISNASAVTPWYASLAAVAQVTSAGAGMVNAVSSATYSGRENGGPVLAGQTYEVGEKNKPEMLMIPGNNGKVFSNAEMKSAMGGGSGTVLNQTINNNAAASGYEVHSRGDGVTTPQVIDIVASQMSDPNSRGRRGMGVTSNTQNRVRPRR